MLEPSIGIRTRSRWAREFATSLTHLARRLNSREPPALRYTPSEPKVGQPALDANGLAALAAADEPMTSDLHADEGVTAVGAGESRDRCHDDSNRDQ